MILLRWVGAILLAYLLGSIPTGYLAAKLFKNIDIRRIGSGRTGGTNVLRSAGVAPAVLTVLGDVFKGYAAVALAKALLPDAPLAAALAGLLVVVGHNRSLFLGFHGGVGTMTTLGAALALIPAATVPIMLAGAAVVALSRYASLGSLTVAGLLVVGCLAGALLGAWPAAYLLFALGAGLLSTWELRANIARLRQGTERKVGQSA